MLTPQSSMIEPRLTIESVHGFKETVIVGPGGISPVTSSDAAAAQSAGRQGGGIGPVGVDSGQSVSRRSPNA